MKRLIAPLVALLLLGAFPTSVSASITHVSRRSSTMTGSAHDAVSSVMLQQSGTSCTAL